MWAVVTGGSSGLGFAIARRLALKGYDLVLVSRSQARLEAAAAEIGETGRKVLVFPLDLSLPESPQRLYDWTEAGGIVPDVLVNDAGMYVYEKLTDIDAKKAESLINLNVSALTSLCRLYGSRMCSMPDRKKHARHILNIASYSVYMPVEGFSLYASSKAYVRLFSRCIAKEFRREGVYVTAVAPAGIDTGLMNLRPPIRRLASRLGFLASADRIARISLRAMGTKCIRYWIPVWYNVLFIPFIWMFQPLFKKVLK